jgi:hypothetical protein
MGYAVTAPCKSYKAKAEMLAFLKEHFRSPDTFIDNMDDDGLYGPVGEGLDYSHGKCEVGFEFTSWSPAREFAIALCRWMALRMGRRRKLKPFEGHKCGIRAVIPYYVYDGCEAVPVRLESEWFDKAPEECKSWTFVDEHGWTDDTFFAKEMAIGLYPDNWGKAMHDELKRLSKLWEERHEAST